MVLGGVKGVARSKWLHGRTLVGPGFPRRAAPAGLVAPTHDRLTSQVRCLGAAAAATTTAPTAATTSTAAIGPLKKVTAVRVFSVADANVKIATCASVEGERRAGIKGCIGKPAFITQPVHCIQSERSPAGQTVKPPKLSRAQLPLATQITK